MRKLSWQVWAILGCLAVAGWIGWMAWGRPISEELLGISYAPTLNYFGVLAAAACFGRAIMLRRSAHAPDTPSLERQESQPDR